MKLKRLAALLLAGLLTAASFSALAASMVGTAQRMMSQPAASRARIWAAVASTSSVLVLVMDWIIMGLPPPIFLFPICITFVWSLYIFFLLYLKGTKGMP